MLKKANSEPDKPSRTVERVRKVRNSRQALVELRPASQNTSVEFIRPAYHHGWLTFSSSFRSGHETRVPPCRGGDCRLDLGEASPRPTRPSESRNRHGDRYPARQPEEPGQEETKDVSTAPAGGRFHASTFQSLGPNHSWCRGSFVWQDRPGRQAHFRVPGHPGRSVRPQCVRRLARGGQRPRGKTPLDQAHATRTAARTDLSTHFSARRRRERSARWVLATATKEENARHSRDQRFIGQHPEASRAHLHP